MPCIVSKTSRSTLLGAGLLLGIIGCGGNGGRSIPHEAIELQGGRIVSAIAPRLGTVWVYDREADEVAYTGLVHKGDHITVDNDRHLRVAGADIKTLKAAKAGHKDRYIVYFQP